MAFDLLPRMASMRRHVLLRIFLGAGGLGLGPGLLRVALASNPAAGLRAMEGPVLIDGKPGVLGQQVGMGQRVETGPGAHAVFVVGEYAFLQRANSSFVLETSAGVLVLRYLAGQVLSVFGEGRKQLETPTASISLRGTGCYIEADAMRTYFCLCYGSALVIPKGDPNRRKALRTRHHDVPIYIDRSAGRRAVLPAHAVNHRDDELIMLEALVGRRPPFLEQPYYSRRY
jgi:hypothetical protein